jgi:glycosyltransferase involved in cell wall biosynthesis
MGETKAFSIKNLSLKTVLFIDADGGWGGAPKSLLTLVKHLNSNDFRPVLLIGMPGPVIDEYRKRGISLYVEPLSCFVYHRNNRGSLLKKITMMVRMGPKVIMTLRKIVKLEEIDLVHINSVVILPTALLFKMFFSLPVIFHVREMLLENIVGKIQNKLIYFSGDKIVVPSENEARQFAKGKECDKVLVRYNPVDMREFQFSSVERERIRREVKVDEGTIILSTIGAIVPGKGQDRIIEIVRDIKKQYDGKIKFLIVGKIDIPKEKGRMRKLLRFVRGENKLQKFQLELAEKIIQYGLQDDMTIMDHRRDVWRILSASDIVVRTSRLNDPWGRDIIESMAVGRPIVATGTYDRFLENGVNGFLVPPQRTEEETIKEISEKLLILIRDRELRESMGKNNVIKGRILFDPQKYALSMDEIYKSALDKKLKLST